MKLDEIDFSILKELKEDSKLTFKDIGEKLHMTGQAVGTRVNKLVDEGVIERFTIDVNSHKLGIVNTSFVKIYMNSYDHSKINTLINKYDEITEAFRISSDCCYLLKIETSDNMYLNSILDEITTFANYQVSISLDKVK